MTVVQLKELLKSAGKPVSGKKAELISRFLGVNRETTICIIAGTGMEPSEDFRYQSSWEIRSDTPWASSNQALISRGG
ncbi:MAG: hypothetical protein CM15mP48_0030 [Candidatus Poseidoniales archaeon]|nr:MAG: hypothetical protein CM15mP48_0030 [Candidatus Poseidoniales archaeon]